MISKPIYPTTKSFEQSNKTQYPDYVGNRIFKKPHSPSIHLKAKTEKPTSALSV